MLTRVPRSFIVALLASVLVATSGCLDDPSGDIAIAKAKGGQLIVLAALCPGNWVQKVAVDRWDTDVSVEEPVEVFWAIRRSPTSDKSGSLRTRYGVVPDGFAELTAPGQFRGAVSLDILAGLAAGGTREYYLDFDASDIPVGGVLSIKGDVYADPSSFEAGARDDC
jgi:hypothetical protein